MKKYIAGLFKGNHTDYANARTMKLLARSIHKLTLISKNNSGKVTSSNVAEFASPQSVWPKKIGY